MLTFRFKGVAIAGFTEHDVKEGETATLIARDAFTSDDHRFYLYVSQMSDIYLRKLNGPVGPVSRFLAVHHADDWVDVYVNDFNEAITYTLNRGIEAGEPFFKKDISDIQSVTFPDIEIVETDAIVYCAKINWKFGLFFDYTRKLDVDRMAVDIGTLHKTLEFEDYLIRTEAAIRSGSESGTFTMPIVITEGKTDWRHLKNAVTKLGVGSIFELHEFNDDRGDDDALKMCRHFATIPDARKRIFMFDRDNTSIIKALDAKTEPGEDFQRWGNNVYSFMIPVPDHRKEFATVSIEFYYTDDEIRTQDADGKRLHFSNELKKEIVPGSPVRRVVIEPVTDLELTKKIDADDASRIFDASDKPVGLSKTAFAENILNGVAGFDNFGVEPFRRIFDMIERISEL